MRVNPHIPAKLATRQAVGGREPSPNSSGDKGNKDSNDDNDI